MLSTPNSVLRAIAKTLQCSVADIETTLERIHIAAGYSSKPIERKAVGEERLYEIRKWLNTPEAADVVQRARDFVVQNT